jgi:hypothetical protein
MVGCRSRWHGLNSVTEPVGQHDGHADCRLGDELWQQIGVVVGDEVTIEQ